ncbi:radical SAM protein [Afifella marina]|uniref:Radical SAM additional 4Fe4S-binding SPASM domain-containing protein n=1 Tax=Afifella marina DSM 2698 TaxID=1120955 RepID=A0A1G5N0R2_AFIMA|nr:radical SAM protein [Afifella marina]SCZ30734.1 radical SAM additional 4Fe4S-binding SPASM domain-containing protein [Afifella marina DSM 2698]
MNLLLIERCNLTCAYCFFAGSLNARPAERGGHDIISEENFRLALRYGRDFVATGLRDSVNLLGGEPTLHPRFRELLAIARSREFALPNGAPLPVNVFSNGIFEPQIAEFLGETPCGLMLNINHPLSYRGRLWRRLNANLDIIARGRGREPFSLSLNLFAPDQEVDFVFDLLERYGARHLRVDVAKPNSAATNTHVGFEALPAMMPLFEKIAERCQKDGIALNTDCCLPVCAVDNERLARLKEAGIFLSFACPGAIDVTPGLQLFYCGPLKHLSFGRIDGYADAKEIVETIEETVQTLRWEVPTRKACETCKWRTLDICQGGCLAFKPLATAERRSHDEEDLHAERLWPKPQAGADRGTGAIATGCGGG